MGLPALAASSGYHVVKSIALGGDGGWDYLNIDPATGNLFITRGTHVMVVDLKAGKAIADLTGLMGIHGTAFAGGKAYVTEGSANQLAVFDSKSFRQAGDHPRRHQAGRYSL